MTVTDYTPRLSVLTDFPGGKVPAQPTVAAVMPLYNEISHVGEAVEGLLRQDYPGLMELWLVDGQSEDGTLAEIQKLSARDPRVRVLSNPQRNQAAANNLVVRQTQCDLVMRIDAHAVYEPDAVRQSVKVLLTTGAAGAGPAARPLAGKTLVSQAIVAAHESRIGIGVAKFRRADSGGWVDTYWGGCYWKYVVVKVGCWREDFRRTEDNDFNARVRAAGYGVYLSPDIKAWYCPRQTLAGLWSQYFANGEGVIQTFFENRSAVGFRHLAPLMFVMAWLAAILQSLVRPAPVPLVVPLAVVYGTALVGFSAVELRKKPGRYALWLPVVFATLHLSYGLGSLRKLFQKLVSGWRSKARLSKPAKDQAEES